METQKPNPNFYLIKTNPGAIIKTQTITFVYCFIFGIFLGWVISLLWLQPMTSDEPYVLPAVILIILLILLPATVGLAIIFLVEIDCLSENDTKQITASFAPETSDGPRIIVLLPQKKDKTIKNKFSNNLTPIISFLVMKFIWPMIWPMLPAAGLTIYLLTKGA